MYLFSKHSWNLQVNQGSEVTDCSSWVNLSDLSCCVCICGVGVCFLKYRWGNEIWSYISRAATVTYHIAALTEQLKHTQRFTRSEIHKAFLHAYFTRYETHLIFYTQGNTFNILHTPKRTKNFTRSETH